MAGASKKPLDVVIEERERRESAAELEVRTMESNLRERKARERAAIAAIEQLVRTFEGTQKRIDSQRQGGCTIAQYQAQANEERHLQDDLEAHHKELEAIRARLQAAAIDASDAQKQYQKAIAARKAAEMLRDSRAASDAVVRERRLQDEADLLAVAAFVDKEHT